jgi:trehalose 6-phosphate synthase
VLTDDMRTGLLQGLLGADVIGFHTARSVRAFLATTEEYLADAEVDHARRCITLGEEVAHVRAYAISVDPDEFALLGQHELVLAEEERLAAERPERLVLRVDRTDPSKNVVRGFHAFARFLARHPEWHGRVRMLALLDPSRQEIPDYAEYVGAIHRAAREVNDQFSDPGWTPIDLRVSDNFAQAIAAYKQYDVLLVNAIVDGMNLIAKEAPLLNERAGVLVLSENAGAHEELGAYALSVNPFDVEGTADAIAEALRMPEEERERRAAQIRAHVREHDVRAWIVGQLADLDSIVEGGAR